MRSEKTSTKSLLQLDFAVSPLTKSTKRLRILIQWERQRGLFSVDRLGEEVFSRARIAQSVEHQTFNLRVQGSSPCSGAKVSICFQCLFKNYLDNSPFKNASEGEEALTVKSRKVTALK